MDFVAVGVGPSSHDEKFVTNEQPADGLSDDLHFVAERMGVNYPPLPPSTIEELAMIKSFCSRHPQPKKAAIE